MESFAKTSIEMTFMKSEAIMAVTVNITVLLNIIIHTHIYMNIIIYKMNNTCSNRNVLAFLRNFPPPSSMKELILPTIHMKFLRFDCNSLGNKQEG
jgi:hypothetical protein